MFKKRHVILFKSIATIIVCLFCTNTISFAKPVGFNISQNTLAAASIFGGLKGPQHKDIANIQLSLQAYLLKYGAGTIDITSLRDTILSENTVYSPTDMHFFFSGKGMENISDKYAVVKCRLKKGDRTEDYYVIFAKEKDDGGFPLEVLTKKEWKKYKKLGLDILPRRKTQKPEDAKAIERYIQHEKGIDSVLEYAHENNLVQGMGEIWSESLLNRLQTLLKLNITTLDGLVPVEKREIFWVKMTPDLKAKMKPVEIVDENGKEHSMNYISHSSNSAIHIFVSEKYFEIFDAIAGHKIEVEPKSEKDDTATVSAYFNADQQEGIKSLIHELGVIFGYPVTEVKDGIPYNLLDKRWEKVQQGERPANELQATVIDLDQNLLTRDYAMGWLRKTPQEKSLLNFGKYAPEIVKVLVKNEGLTDKDINAAISGALTENAREVVRYVLGGYKIDSTHIPDKALARRVSATLAHGRTWRPERTDKERMEVHPYVIDAKRKIEERRKHLTLLIGFSVVTQLTAETVAAISDELDTSKPTGHWVNDEDFDRIKDEVDSGEKGAGIDYINRVAREARMPFEMIVALRKSAEAGSSEDIKAWVEKIFDRAERGQLSIEVVRGTMVSMVNRLSDEDNPDVNGVRLEDMLRQGLQSIEKETMSQPIQGLITEVLQILEERRVEPNPVAIVSLDTNLLTRDYAVGLLMNRSASDDMAIVKATENPKILEKIIKDKLAKKAIEKAKSLAHELGMEISRPVLEENYTLITCGDFYKDEEEKKSDIKDEYGSIFNIEWIKPARPRTTINRILDIVRTEDNPGGLDPHNVMVQLPQKFSNPDNQSEIQRLIDNAPGVRFMIINTQGMKDTVDSSKHRKNIFAMMLLARKITNNDLLENSKLYRLLQFFINTLMEETDNRAIIIVKYIEDLSRDGVGSIVKTIIHWKRPEKIESPDPDVVSAALFSV
ncbi:MAG: hypothetical protein KJ995_03450 [Candidatus Omnitrophica bacterium]|nr:hypothetical protein [Candidatus Omnitrophota bacterium]MBU1127617.1 hypothetical protein [Candidatus Omnitrophota bacterium]MBU1783904.1 hypothetical protein [Candidatus Omnitrophota bacterium]MBU1851442.1 hypothetical protein [Candidatus Omnitrophota bacterium]